ncbi:hypothetical protein SCHPADRAFT_824680, partial [Schizopora paradoxa]
MGLNFSLIAHARFLIGRALRHHDAVDSYMAKDKELRRYELSDPDWEAIKMVTRWLRTFRDATTQMSASRHPTLSTTHAIFRGLQDNVKQMLRDLPSYDPKIADIPRLREGLTAAHRKLSDYHGIFDRSPYYI